MWGCNQPAQVESQTRLTSEGLSLPEDTCNYQKRSPSHQMCRHQHKDPGIVKSQKITKENNTSLVVDSEENRIYEMTDREFRIILLKKVKELQEYMDRKLSELWMSILGQHEKFDKEIEIKTIQVRILEIKNTIAEMRYSMERSGGILG